jgi:hypothetical protein
MVAMDVGVCGQDIPTWKDMVLQIDREIDR